MRFNTDIFEDERVQPLKAGGIGSLFMMASFADMQEVPGVFNIQDMIRDLDEKSFSDGSQDTLLLTIPHLLQSRLLVQIAPDTYKFTAYDLFRFGNEPDDDAE